MHRCFVRERIDDEKNIVICGDEALHMIKVLRFKSADDFEVCDNTGNVGKATVTAIEGKTVHAEITSVYKSEAEPHTKIYLFQGLSKGTKMELVIQKATELGVYAVIPVKMEFSVVKIKEENSKTERWQKIAFEAAKQCKRAVVPEVYQPVDFETAVSMLSKMDFAVVPYECEKDGNLKNILRQNSNIETAGFIIGPEGGFSEKEIALSDRSDIPRVTLGKRILRTETAAITMLSVLMYELGEFNNN